MRESFTDVAYTLRKYSFFHDIIWDSPITTYLLVYFWSFHYFTTSISSVFTHAVSLSVFGDLTMRWYTCIYRSNWFEFIYLKFKIIFYFGCCVSLHLKQFNVSIVFSFVFVLLFRIKNWIFPHDFNEFTFRIKKKSIFCSFRLIIIILHIFNV